MAIPNCKKILVVKNYNEITRIIADENNRLEFYT